MKAAQDFVQAFKEQGNCMVFPSWKPPEDFLDHLTERYDYKNALEWDEFAQLMVGTEHFRVVDGNKFQIDGTAEEVGTKELLETFTRYFCPPSVMGTMLALVGTHPMKAIALAEIAREGVTKNDTDLRIFSYWQSETVRQVVEYFDSLETGKMHPTDKMARDIKSVLETRKEELEHIKNGAFSLPNGYDNVPLRHYEDFVTSYMMHKLFMPADAVQVEKGDVCFAPGVFKDLEYFNFDQEMTQ